METRQQRLIREALEHKSRQKDEESEPEATLRDKALEHTDTDYVPRTLTPHEWEDWYAEHGIPPQHRGASVKQSGGPGLLDRLRQFLAR